MKNEQLSKTIYNSIPIPNLIQKDKKKLTNKNYKKSNSKDKILIKPKIDNKNKVVSTINNNKLNIEIESGSHDLKQKILSKEKINELSPKEMNNKKKPIKTFIKHKTSNNINNSFNNKTPIIFSNTRKNSKIKINNLNIPTNKNENIYIHTYSNKFVNSYLNNNKHKIKKNKNKYNNIIHDFIDNKIDINYNIKKKSFDFTDKNKKQEKIFLLNNYNNSSPLLKIKNKNKYQNKHIKNKFMTEKLLKLKKEKKFLINQNIFHLKKFQKNIKDKNNNNNNNNNNNSNNMSFYTSFIKQKKNSISKNKKEDKPIRNIKKQNNIYQSRLSSSSVNNNQDINSFLINKQELKRNERIETEPKKDNLTIIQENEKLNKKCFNFLHHYLQNTISTKNKIVKKQKEKILSKKNSEEKSKKKRYSFINRNNVLKFDKLLKTKEYLTNTIKTRENSIKRIPSSNKKPKTLNISNFSSASSANNIKVFNGKIDDYLITKELGKGSYASVKLAINKNNKNKYAIKLYPRESLLDPQKRNTVKNEINILKQLDNINIMKLYEVIDTPNYLYLVMEYINGISLLEIIKQDKNHYFEEDRALKIFIQVIKGMIYCQSKDICHRDIKLENILLIKNDIVKIIDFGFAVKTNKETYQKLFCGTPSYMAPEIVNKEKYIAQYSDIWSLGVLFFAMLYGRFPFRAKKQEELFEKINEAKIIFPEEIEVSDQVKELIKKIFIIIPTQRLSLNEILNELNNILGN